MDAVTLAPRVDPAFRADVLAGLAAPIPAVPARWFYDRRGSELFEEITRLPEYYPTRTETALLERHSGEVAAIAGTGDAVVEFGSGSSAKTPILLRAVGPAAYVPIDISGDFLRECGRGAAGRVSRTCRSTRSRPISCSRSSFPPQVAAAAQARLLPRLDDRQHRRPHRGRPAARDEGHAWARARCLLIGMDRIKDVDDPAPRL